MDHQDAVDRVNSVPLSVAERVINVHTTKPYDWVLENVFDEEKCGKRNKTLFWKADKPGSCHFFIEFAHKDSVPIAQRGAGPGVTVHCLSRNMNMSYIFDCLAKGLEPPKKRTNTDTEGSQVGDPPDSAKYSNSSNGPTSAKRQRIMEDAPTRRRSLSPLHRDAPYRPYKQSTTFSQQRTYPYNSKPKPNWNSTSDSREIRDPRDIRDARDTRRYQNDYNNDYQKPRFRNNDYPESNRSFSPPRRPKGDSLYHGARDDDRARGRDREVDSARTAFRRSSDASMKRPSESSLRGPSDVPVPTPSDPYNPASPRFPMPSQQPIVDTLNLSDLDSLSDDNIGAVIDSLKVSSIGPDMWMTVAAHYRRKNLHKNALAVVDTMLEVMRERGWEKADLRPGLLMMAQCHHSLAKQLSKEPESQETSNKHFVLLLEWLRETYGPSTPAMDAIAQSGVLPPWSAQKENIAILPKDPYDFSQRISIPGYESLQSGPSIFDTHSSMPARLDAVTEENTRLRDSREATSTELTACRASLLEAENAARLTEVKLTRAMEDHRLAVATAQREAEARRRLDERFVLERKAWERRTEELREDGARAAMRELNAILTLSAPAPISMLGAARGRVEREGAPNTA